MASECLYYRQCSEQSNRAVAHESDLCTSEKVSGKKRGKPANDVHRDAADILLFTTFNHSSPIIHCDPVPVYTKGSTGIYEFEVSVVEVNLC